MKVVIFRALQLGDMLCAIPAFRAIRSLYREAEISLVGLPWSREFVRRFPKYLDRFISFPGYPGLPEKPADVRQFPQFIRSMQKEKFALAIQMHGNGVLTNGLVTLFGAKRVAGFYEASHFVPNKKNFSLYPDTHEIRRNLKLARILGASQLSEDLEFPVWRSDFLALESVRHLKETMREPYVCLHPGARLAEKRWSPENFARIGDHLASRGYRIILTGSSWEAEIIAAVEGAMKFPTVNTAPLDLPLGALAALIKESRLFVSNDTGAAHLATAVGTPSVTVFIATDPGIWGPLRKDRHRVVQTGQSRGVFQVSEEVEKLLANPLSEAQSQQNGNDKKHDRHAYLNSLNGDFVKKPFPEERSEKCGKGRRS